MTRQGSSLQEASRNERIDALLGIRGNPDDAAIRLGDMRPGARMDRLVSALKTAGIVAPFLGQFAGSPAFLRPASGAYVGNGANGALSTVAGVADRVSLTPWICPWPVTIDEAGISCSTAIAASSCKVVIYDADPIGRPSRPIAETSNISTAATGTLFASLNATLAAGAIYWLGVRFSSTQTVRSLANTSAQPIAWSSAATPAPQFTLNDTLAFGMSAAPWVYANTQLAETLPPLILLRVA